MMKHDASIYKTKRKFITMSGGLDVLHGICARISLNVPEQCSWQWDGEFELALLVFDMKDSDLMYFPLSKEFDKQWDFTSIEDPSNSFCTYINSAFGVVPGQMVFTSNEIDGLMLFAAWWPWGDESKVSLRVGLISSKEPEKSKALHKAHLQSWFSI
jgi:hypothetical protein